LATGVLCMAFVIALTVLSYALLHAAAGAELPANAQTAWDVLDKSLHDGSTERRQQAIAALSTMGEIDGAVKRATLMLDDKDPLVRQSAALALGAMHAHAAAPRLEQAVDDSSPEVAFAAAKALIEIGDPAGEPMLIAVLSGERKDGPGMMTNAMRKAKDKLHHPAGLALMGAQDATGAMFGPVSFVIPAVKDAVDLKGKGAPGRAAAAAYLVKDPDPYAIALLEWALGDDNQFVRFEAARGLGQRGNAGSIPKLEADLNDSKTMVRDMVAAAIIRIADRNGEPGPVPTNPVVTQPQKK
jgi:HEAT repeat protein